MTVPLDIHDLGKAYAGREVLTKVNLRLDPGERALLLGPSGSGKSTLLNCLCGLERPDHGTVTVDQEIIADAIRPVRSDSIRRRHFGIVFQKLRLVSALTVRKNLLLAQRLQTSATNPDQVDEILERLGIADRAKARPFELSQGEAQRAAIARALVVSPSILIADEPTSALDRGNTEAVAHLLIEVADEAGASLLIATHDDRLRAYFARTMVLQDGRIAA